MSIQNGLKMVVPVMCLVVVSSISGSTSGYSNCAVEGTRRCLEDAYALLPKPVVLYPCPNGTTCRPIDEQDVSYVGVVLQSPGWQSLVEGDMATCHAKFAIGCACDAGTGTCRCVCSEAFSDFNFATYSNPAYPRNCQ